ncbi:MAG: glycosyltransferase involved in cell wall biosynthesis [Limisphaerales bacterium]
MIYKIKPDTKDLLLLTPWYAGSHKAWADGYKKSSKLDIDVWTLPGRFWKWRMHGAAVHFANKFLNSKVKYQRILATDMMDLAVFAGLIRSQSASIPIDLYMHENQLAYPWSPTDPDVSNKDQKEGRDRHYGFINWTSALAADNVYFNSKFNQQSFLQALPQFLAVYPDTRSIDLVRGVAKKSKVLYSGMDLLGIGQKKKFNEVPVLLWNHRWEYDKNPELFFRTLIKLKKERIEFKLIVVGEQYKKIPTIFDEAKQKLSDRIIHFGYVEKHKDYLALICTADILPVTATHDFFGVSVVQAMYIGLLPVLPNNLAYPEHMPANCPAEINLYEEGSFESSLRAALVNYRSYDAKIVQSHLSSYDWTKISPIYDAHLTL